MIRAASTERQESATTRSRQEELLLAVPPPMSAAPGSWSPDGRFLLYGWSNPATGRDMWVLPFDGQQKPSPILNSRFEERIALFSPDGTMMAVPIKTTGPVPEMGTPIALFRPRILYGGTQPLGAAAQFDVAPDGRFLVNVNITGAAPITVIQNWRPNS